jgi:hypothetical protein
MSKHLRDEARRTLELLDTLDRDLRDPEILLRLPPTLLAMVITQAVLLSSAITTDERLERLQVVNND